MRIKNIYDEPQDFIYKLRNGLIVMPVKDYDNQNKLRGRAIANPKEEIDDRMGKLVSFIRALEFDKDTEKRLINNLFITESELEDVTKLKEKNKKLEKQRTDLINTNGRIKDKLSETYLEIVHDINNAILFNRD